MSLLFALLLTVIADQAHQKAIKYSKYSIGMDLTSLPTVVDQAVFMEAAVASDLNILVEASTTRKQQTSSSRHFE